MTEALRQIAGSVATTFIAVVGVFHPKRVLLWLIRAYQKFVSPLTRPSCRFVPSCSVYAAQSIERHGVFKGVWLAVRRLLRCHPFSAGGYDPP